MEAVGSGVWSSQLDDSDDDSWRELELGATEVALDKFAVSSMWSSPDDDTDEDGCLSLQLGTRCHSGETATGNSNEASDVSYEVERILQRRTHVVFGLQYKVRFLLHSNRHNRWVRPNDGDMSELIADFEDLVAIRGDLPANLSTDAQAEQFYYGERGVRSPSGTLAQDRAEVRVSEISNERVSRGPVPGPWQRATSTGRGAAEAGTRQWEGRSLWPTKPREGGDDVPQRGERTGERGAASFNKGAGKGMDRNTGKGGKGPWNGDQRGRGFMGPSLADKIEANSHHTGRRAEVYIGPQDDRLRQAAALTLVNSMSKNTRRTYDGNFKLWLGFCERQNLSPILDGSDKRGEEARLIEYVMYEFDVHRNKYSTIKVKLSAIRAAMMDEGYANPLDNKPTLSRHLKGIKVLRGGTEAKEPLPAEAFRHLLEQTQDACLLLRAAALAIAIAFFFLLRVSEFAARDKWYMEDFILLRQDVSFFCDGKLCDWNHPRVNAVELHIRGSKTDQQKRGCRRMQQATGDETLCPVRCMVEWFALTEGSHIPHLAPLFSVPKGRAGLEWNVLTRDTVTLLMKGVATDFGMPPEHVATHSIRISGATALLLAGMPPEVVQIVGRWASNAFIGYTRYQAELMAGVAKRMINTGYVVRQW